MNKEIINKFNKRISEVLKLAINKYGVDELRDVTVDYSLKGKCAGQAIRDAHGKLILKFNKEAIEKDFEGMFNDTIPHEVAHLVCFVRPYFGKNHDKGWKRVCESLGGKSDRTHNIKLTPARKRSIYRYVYELKSGTPAYLTKQMHDKVRMGIPMYLKSTRERVKVENFVKKIKVK